MFVLNCFIRNNFKQTEMFPTIVDSMQKAEKFANEFDNFQIHVAEGRTKTFLKGKSCAEGHRVMWNEEYYGEIDKHIPGKKIIDFMTDEGILVC